MDEAAAEFAALRRGELQWVVQRMVCPVAWLPDLLERMPAVVDAPWPISVLGTSVEGYPQDMAAIEVFERQAGDRAYVEALEVKANAGPLKKEFLKHLANAGFEEVFVEVPITEAGRELIHALAEFEVLGAKGRTGGLEAVAFPPASELAAWLLECVSLDLTFKLTAGLHHATPTRDEALGVTQHGFVNVVAAVALALHEDFGVRELQAILEGDVTMNDRGIMWKDFVIDAEKVERTREVFRSIGSCSIYEPLESLQTMTTGVAR